MASKDALFVTDGQLADRMGLSLDQIKAKLPVLAKSGFPSPDPMFENRRYWPACKAFLDRRYGLSSSSGQGAPALDGEEKW